jgi:hypothetical protein
VPELLAMPLPPVPAPLVLIGPVPAVGPFPLEPLLHPRIKNAHPIALEEKEQRRFIVISPGGSAWIAPACTGLETAPSGALSDAFPFGEQGIALDRLRRELYILAVDGRSQPGLGSRPPGASSVRAQRIPLSVRPKPSRVVFDCRHINLDGAKDNRSRTKASSAPNGYRQADVTQAARDAGLVEHGAGALVRAEQDSAVLLRGLAGDFADPASVCVCEASSATGLY